MIFGFGSMLLATVRTIFLLVTGVATVVLLLVHWAQRCPQGGRRLVRGVFPLIGPLPTPVCRNCGGAL